jgi:hypothetical protein
VSLHIKPKTAGWWCFMIRIANGSGFWGDSLEAPLQLIRGGPIDYLTLDFLAEITMSILQKMRARDPQAGYARDFVDMAARMLPESITRRIKVITNAGGINPEGCRNAIAAVARKAGLAGRLKIGIVTGDDIFPHLDSYLERGYELTNLDTGAPLASIRSRVQSANVYFGAHPVAQALAEGAEWVITGRCADASLTLGPLLHEFKWPRDDWDRLAAGTVAGHIIECGAQCTGGNCQADWQAIPNLAEIGYPIVEAEPDGTFTVTKHNGTGGRVSVASVTEQLLYEIGDPRRYVTPDCVADFTSIRLKQTGEDRVSCAGIKGLPATESYKVSISYSAGFKAVGYLVYAWPNAYRKAQAADRILRRRLELLGLSFDRMTTEFVGVNACHGPLAGEPSPEIAEVAMRVAVASGDRAVVERFTKELAPLALNGPPTVAGLGSGRPNVEEVVAYWPALLPKSEVRPQISIAEV